MPRSICCVVAEDAHTHQEERGDCPRQFKKKMMISTSSVVEILSFIQHVRRAVRAHSKL